MRRRARPIRWSLLPKGSYVLEVHERTVPSEPAAILPPARTRAGRLGWVAAATILGLLGLLLWKWDRKPVVEALLSTFEVELKSPGTIGAVVGTDVIISPDGTWLVLASQASDGVSHLSVHRLDRSQTRELPGTEGARGQFFSPDDAWVGFWRGDG